MEPLSEFWRNVKERVSNPLIFSFILAWLIYNWEITLGLFWLDSNEIRLTGNANLVDYIKAKANKPGGICWPITIAVLYCIFVPLFKEALRSFNAVVFKYGSKLYFYISEDSKIDFNLFVEQARQIEKHKKDIDTLLKDVVETAKSHSDTKTKLESTVSAHDALAIKLGDEEAKVKSFRDLSILQGTWQINPDINPKSRNEVTISNDIWMPVAHGHVVPYSIEIFFYDSTDQLMTFHRVMHNKETDEVTARHVYVLTVHDKRHMSGTVDNTPIVLRRKMT